MRHYLTNTILEKMKCSSFESYFKAFETPSFYVLKHPDKVNQVCRILLQWIEDTPEEMFALPFLLKFIEKVNQEQILPLFHFHDFEFWLNQFSDLTDEENQLIRGKIVGRYLPKENYQNLFPLGGAKNYPGTHFVLSHPSPDLDTTVASFWGWVDAFGSRVSRGLHMWNLSEKPRLVELNLLFYPFFGEKVFSYSAQCQTNLSCTALDLATQKGLIKKELKDSFSVLDREEYRVAVIINKEGAYLGELGKEDKKEVEGINQLFHAFLQAQQGLLDHHLKKASSAEETSSFLTAFLEQSLVTQESMLPFAEDKKSSLDCYLSRILEISEGIQGNMLELASAMDRWEIPLFKHFVSVARTHQKMCDSLLEIFEKGVHAFSLRANQFDIAEKIKERILHLSPSTIDQYATFEEIQNKMGSSPYLIVVATESAKLYPLGVIYAVDLNQTPLGTLSLRDFSNKEEKKIPPYLEVISIIDHHKTSFASSNPISVSISDTESSNSLVAELSFQLSDLYSTGGMELLSIEKQIKELEQDDKNPVSLRILQRLLQKKYVYLQKQGTPYFVSPEREMLEYMHYLYAIFDDTDLLSKISLRDVTCVASLINRLTSLTLKKEVEVIYFDDFPRDRYFLQKAALRILQHEKVYPLYHEVYLLKVALLDEALLAAFQGKPGLLFADTKTQNGCCRIGQVKLFADNFPLFKEIAEHLITQWANQALKVYHKNQELNFHLQMISTVAGAEEVRSGEVKPYAHLDEFWFWIPDERKAVENAKWFFSHFISAPQLKEQIFQVECLGNSEKLWQNVLEKSNFSLSYRKTSSSLSIAIFRFKAGSLNSRKTTVTPYLPKKN